MEIISQMPFKLHNSLKGHWEFQSYNTESDLILNHQQFDSRSTEVVLSLPVNYKTDPGLRITQNFAGPVPLGFLISISNFRDEQTQKQLFKIKKSDVPQQASQQSRNGGPAVTTTISMMKPQKLRIQNSSTKTNNSSLPHYFAFYPYLCSRGFTSTVSARKKYHLTPSIFLHLALSSCW